MGATSIERPGNGQDEEQGAADVASSASQADRPPNDVMRSWLARGIHTVGIDPRRLGGRGDARRVLGEDRRSASRAAGSWRELASALQRHTLHSALTRLRPIERQVVTLAYLEGLTNRQIAATLGVSISTVRRRLWLGLDHLDDYVRSTGTWVSSILLLGLVWVIDRFARLGQLANAAVPGEWPHKLAATVAVGAGAAAGFGVVAANSHSSTAQHESPPATGRLIQSLPGATMSALPKALPLSPGAEGRIIPSSEVRPSAITTGTKATTAVADSTGEKTQQGDGTSGQGDHHPK